MKEFAISIPVYTLLGISLDLIIARYPGYTTKASVASKLHSTGCLHKLPHPHPSHQNPTAGCAWEGG
jgi:hypothetical protein